MVMRDLGAFGGANSRAQAINAPGFVAGGVFTGGIVHPILSTGHVIDLGTLGGSQGIARGLNDSGQVVGYSSTAGNAASHAFLYRAGKMFDLGTLGGLNSAANAVNNQGAVVGNAELISGSVTSTHAFLFSGGAMSDLGTLGGNNSSAAAISSLNYIVGGAQTSTSASHAFLSASGKIWDLGTLGGLNSAAFGINDSGLIVGISQIRSIVTGAPVINAFLYSSCQLLNLNTMIPAHSGWILTKALAINNAGQIVGVGQFNGQTRAFLLSPSGSAATNTDPTACPNVQLQGVTK
jgi:probable HAF family extracellular repeat protein